VLYIGSVVGNPDICSSFTILRTTGQFAPDGWQPNAPTFISAYGAVRNVSGKEISMLPEADRVHEAVTVRTTTQLFVTNEDNDQVSDVLQWQGAKYRLLNVRNYSEQGYWFAMGVRMAGQ
jgi:hypothetical protein